MPNRDLHMGVYIGEEAMNDMQRQLRRAVEHLALMGEDTRQAAERLRRAFGDAIQAEVDPHDRSRINVSVDANAYLRRMALPLPQLGGVGQVINYAAESRRQRDNLDSMARMVGIERRPGESDSYMHTRINMDTRINMALQGHSPSSMVWVDEMAINQQNPPREFVEPERNYLTFGDMPVSTTVNSIPVNMEPVGIASELLYTDRPARTRQNNSENSQNNLPNLESSSQHGINYYHEGQVENKRRLPRMKKASGFNQERTWGVEIEFCNKHHEVFAALLDKGLDVRQESYNHSDRSWWKLTTDSSAGITEDVGGYELVSPPIKGEEGFRQLQIVCETLKEVGVVINERCGLHVHHNASDFTVDTFKRIFALYTRFESAMDELHIMGRRADNNEYAHSIKAIARSADSGSGFWLSLNNAVTDNDLYWLFSNRYCKVNYQAYVRHGTIEFRQHTGTCDFNDIKNWIVLTQAIVERCISGTINIEEGATDWFNFKKVIRGYAWMGADELLQEAVKHFNKRRRELAKEYRLELAS